MNINGNIKRIVLVVLCLASGILGSVVTILVLHSQTIPIVSTQASSKLDSLKLDGRFDVVLFEVEAYSTAQTADLIQAQAYTDTVVFSVGPSGDVLISGTLTTSDTLAFAGDLDMSNAKIINIGDPGTDFQDDGGLITAQTVTITAGGIVVSSGGADVTGDFDVSGLSELDGGFTVDDTAFSVADATGNTNISGTLAVSSTAVFSSGIAAVTNQYGPGLWVKLYGEAAPEHSNQTGSYDHTGGAFETLFTRTAGDNFAQADEDNGNWILLTGANLGAMAEIKTYINANTVIVEGLGWDGDLASQTFEIYPHPSAISGADARHEFSVESGGEFEVHSYSFTGGHVMEVENEAAADGSSALLIKVEGGGYSNLFGTLVEFETGDLQPGDTVIPLCIAVDETGAVSSSATTEMDALVLETTDATTMTKHAIHVGTGFDSALAVSGGTALDSEYGYEVASGSVVTRTSEFSSTLSNVEIFDSLNDYILIGSDNTFEVIAVNLAINSNKDIDFAYYYSKAGGAWTSLVIDSDTTNGFQNSGIVRFNAPGDWAKDDEAEINGDVTNAYYVKLLRQFATPVPTLPTESFFQIFTDQASGMEIKGSGLVILPYLAGIPADVENGAIWMQADGLHIYYNGAEALVADGGP